MKIEKVDDEDLKTILELQYLAYQSEAALLNDYDIPPLKQTLSEVEDEYATGTILKAVDEEDNIIGSIRAHKKNDTLYIGKLFVHPRLQKRGIGTALLRDIEKICPAKRYELFTSDQSKNNIRLYEKSGYTRFKEQEVSPTLRMVFLEKSGSM